MPIVLIALIVLAVGSVAAAVWVFTVEQARRQLVQRAAAPGTLVGEFRVLVTEKGADSVISRLLARLPRSWSADNATAEALIHAGYDSPSAPIAYTAGRIALATTLVLFALTFAPKQHFEAYVAYIVVAGSVGWLLPMWMLRRFVAARQEKVRRSLPDCLDLLVVCIEAGISLDAALLRVAKDMGSPHPILARELLIINQKTNAGMTRQDALRGLYERTGVGEVRALVSHIVQGEKWGTSTGKVLRVYAETLRRERKQAAEKKAATAPVKMLIPLGLFIFPAILLVVMGPVVVAVSKMFAQH